jgi:VWFA-related protein
MSRRATLLCTILLIAMAIEAQHTETVTVEVVDVPVYVYRAATPINGLTRDDFELFVNGKRQSIDYFDVIGEVTSPADATPDTPDDAIRERRLFLLVFDLAYSPPAAIVRAQRAALDLVAHAAASDVFSVATFTARRGVDYIVPFTPDRQQVQHAIVGLGLTSARDPLGLIITPPPSFLTATEDGGLPDDAYFLVNAAAAVASGDAIRDNVRTREARTIEHQLTELGAIGARLAPLKGTKHVILMSPGFDSYVISDLSLRRGPKPPAANVRLINLLETMYRQYQAAGVFLHAVDTAGLRIGADVLSNDALHLLAAGTGGQVIRNRNDLGAALAELISAQQTGYLLGFRPAGVRDGYNKIVVKLKDDAARGATMRYRKGFSTAATPADVTNGMYLADIILNDVPQTGVAVKLDAMGGALMVRLPLQAIAEQLGGSGKAEVLLYIVDDHGTVVDFHQRTVDVVNGMAKQGLLTLQLNLPKGNYVAKALLRVGDSVGYAKLAFAR